MFDIGVPELVVVLVIVLIVFGPGRLPEIGHALGKAIGEFRQATREVKKQTIETSSPESQVEAKKET